MTDTTQRFHHDSAVSEPTPTTSHNPYLIALVSFGAFAWLIAFMLWISLAGVTDYETYDVVVASALATWIDILVVGGFVAMVGAAVIAGVRRELRLATR